MRVKGYSMIETLVALAIATMLVLGFHNLSGSLTKARYSSRLAQEAQIIAGNKLEELLSDPSELATMPIGSLLSDTSTSPDFNLTYMVSSVEYLTPGSDNQASLYTIEVRVSYDTGEKILSTKYYVYHE